jgi:hypothetical protein
VCRFGDRLRTCPQRFLLYAHGQSAIWAVFEPSCWEETLGLVVSLLKGARPIACDLTLDTGIDTKHPANSGDKKNTAAGHSLSQVIAGYTNYRIIEEIN